MTGSRLRAASLAAAVALAAANPAAADQKPVVELGMVGRPDIAAFEIAIERGYFARQGLDIDPVLASSGQEFAAALASNQIQVASAVPNAALFNALNRGIDIRIVADEAHAGGADDRIVSIMARADLMASGAVKGPADLKGRTIAAGPLPGQYPDLLFHLLFEKGGFTERDVSVVHLTFPDALAALAAKQVDAAFLIEPLVRQAQDHGIARTLVTAGALDPGAELSVVQYSAAFAADTDAATRFMVAYLEGVRDFHDAIFSGKDEDAIIAILVRTTSLKDAKIWKQDMFRHTDLNGRLNVADLARQAAFYKAQGSLAGPIPELGKYVDQSFAAAAVTRIGER